MAFDMFFSRVFTSLANSRLKKFFCFNNIYVIKILLAISTPIIPGLFGTFLPIFSEKKYYVSGIKK